MSLKNISLDPFLLAQLYKTAMVPVAPAATGIRDPVTASSQPPATLPSLGGNKKHISLLIHDADVPYLSDSLFEFLTKILGACGLSMDDVALVNKAPLADLTFAGLHAALSPEKIILLGPEFNSWAGQSLTKNEPAQWEGCSFLLTDRLEEMQGDPAAKKSFWQALQVLFDLKK